MMNSNEFNLSIKDFQIIKSASLTFLPGLNCIVGQSNNGKSAILRAAKSCIYNTPGTTQVRLGTNNYAVGIQLNGHTVIIQKGTNNLYKIDGKIIEKIGRSSLQEVGDALGIRELNLNGNNEQINFLDQMEKPFLLDRSETELFRFIVDSGKDNNVTSALKAITQDRQQISKNISLTEGALIQQEENIRLQEEALVGSDEKIQVCQRVIELGSKIQRCKDLKTLYTKVTDNIEQKSKLSKEVYKIEETLNAIEPLIEDINTKLKKQNIISELVDRIEKSKSSLDNYTDKVQKISVIVKNELPNLVERYKYLSELESNLNVSKNELERLSNMGKVPEYSKDFKDNVSKYQVVEELLTHITQLNTQLEQGKENLALIDTELEETKKRIDMVGVCPTCGQPMHS